MYLASPVTLVIHMIGSQPGLNFKAAYTLNPVDAASSKEFEARVVCSGDGFYKFATSKSTVVQERIHF